ncbi:hypothetical protein DUNSADRAFT_16688 [Dunaliella salina]|uniref:Uncharacterized protein n=1 Tax=Dunaliella salina TaxID=3046 RepID=A0ABQ7H0T1_DUNSA|nr:hypothetical protein DUNSADRAFT_16688 [Dunaliella salina]|eukprot:KAF5840454.1 hypothetical protein DUNSADRAFT_16688 [Dunaliella salina]
MPAVHALGRRWHLSSDDLVVPGAFGSIFFATWTGLLAAAEARIERGSLCPTSAFADYVSALLAFSAVSCVLHALLAWQSYLGSLLDEAKRRAVPWLLHLIGVVYGGMLGLIIWGTVLMDKSQSYTTANSTADCSSSGQWRAIARTIVYGSWAAIGMVFLVHLHMPRARSACRCTCTCPGPTALACAPAHAQGPQRLQLHLHMPQAHCACRCTCTCPGPTAFATHPHHTHHLQHENPVHPLEHNQSQEQMHHIHMQIALNIPCRIPSTSAPEHTHSQEQMHHIQMHHNHIHLIHITLVLRSMLLYPCIKQA